MTNFFSERNPPHRKALLLSTVFTGCATLAWPGAGFAETPALEDLIKLDLEDLMQVRIGVASRFEQSALDVGATVESISENQWQKRGARRLNDAIGHLPSTLVLPNAFGADNVLIRGYADTNNISGVATLWDGVPLHTVQSGSSAFDRQNINLGTLDRIEMIRGPASSLYGEDAFHGVLSLKSFESDKDTARAGAEYADNGYYQASAKYSQGIGGGWRLHATAATSGQPDQGLAYRYSGGVGTRDYRYNSSTAVLKLNSDPAQDLSYRFGLYHDDYDSRGFLSNGTVNLGRDSGGSQSSFSMGQAGAMLRLNADTSIETKGFYWNKDHIFSRATSPTVDLVAHGREAQWGASVTLRQQALFGNTRWSAGLDYRHADVGDAYQARQLYPAGVVQSTAAVAAGNYTRDVASLFLDADSAFAAGRFHLNYGGRYDDYSDFGSHFSPRLGAIYHPDAQSALKLLYGHAFRAPASSEIRGTATIAGNPAIKPETIDSYELIYQRQSQDTSTSVGVFRNRWNDAIASAGGRFDNSGKNSAHGAEASFTYQGAPWSVELSGSYVRSQNDITGQDFVAFPKWILNAGVGYRFARYQTEVFLANRFLLGLREGQIAASLPNPAPLQDYWRSDLNISKRLDRALSLSLDVRNLFNRKNALPSIQTFPSPGGIPDEARSIRLALRYAL